MRNWIFAAALVAIAAPGLASAQTGYAGAVYNNVDVDGGASTDSYGLEGAVAFAGSSSISFEIDAAIVDGDDTDSASSLTGHVFTRNESHLFGAFVGVADSDSSTTWTAGLEANKYFADWTLAGALAYANNDDSDIDGYGLNVEGRYFVNDNFRLQANAGLAKVDYSTDDDTATTLGVGGEYQFAALPVSLALGYSHSDVNDADVQADVISLAVRYNWGGSLRDRDRNGASQAGIAGISSAFSL